MGNTGEDMTRYVINAGLCRRLAEQTRALSVEIFLGFAAKEAIVAEGVGKGSLIGDMGVGAVGQSKGARGDKCCRRPQSRSTTR